MTTVSSLNSKQEQSKDEQCGNFGSFNDISMLSFQKQKGGKKLGMLYF